MGEVRPRTLCFVVGSVWTLSNRDGRVRAREKPTRIQLQQTPRRYGRFFVYFARVFFDISRVHYGMARNTHRLRYYILFERLINTYNIIYNNIYIMDSDDGHETKCARASTETRDKQQQQQQQRRFDDTRGHGELIDTHTHTRCTRRHNRRGSATGTATHTYILYAAAQSTPYQFVVVVVAVVVAGSGSGRGPHVPPPRTTAVTCSVRGADGACACVQFFFFHIPCYIQTYYYYYYCILYASWCRGLRVRACVLVRPERQMCATMKTCARARTGVCVCVCVCIYRRAVCARGV